MTKLQASSALYTNYKPGRYGAPGEQPLILREKRAQSMLNLVVWDEPTINASLSGELGISLPDVCESTTNGRSVILWIGPGRYLIVSLVEKVQHKVSPALKDECGAIQDISSARTIINIEGKALRQVMAKGLAVQLDELSFKPGQVILSSFDHHYPAIIHNVTNNQTAFDIYISRSFALSFWEWLCDSCLEYGYEVADSAS